MVGRFDVSRCCCDVVAPSYELVTARFNFWTFQTSDTFCSTSGDIDPLVTFPATGMMYASASNCTPAPVRYFEWGIGVAIFGPTYTASKFRISLPANSTFAPNQYATTTVNVYYDLTTVTTSTYTTPINRSDLTLCSGSPFSWSWAWGSTDYHDLDAAIVEAQADPSYTLGDPIRFVIRPVDLMSTSDGTNDLDAQGFNTVTATAEVSA